MNDQFKVLLRIENFKKKNLFIKKKIKFLDTNYWNFNSSIYHDTNKFFKIHGYNIKTNFPKDKNFYQPLISQNEIGYLVIFKAIEKKKTYFLLQLKAEPGNKNIIQLSPTIQATKSNYTRVHGGKKTKFLEYTINKKNFLLDINQPEQGSRYFKKFNKNIIIKTNKIKNLPKNFVWVEKKEIEKLSKINNLLNMDTISILSCYLKKNNLDDPINSLKKIQIYHSNFKKKYNIKLKKISLKSMRNWEYKENKVLDKKKQFFNIECYKIITNSREVSQWSQPLISDHYHGLNVLFVKKINNSMHYLCQIILEPGYNIPKFTNTIMQKNFNNKDFLNNFLKKNKIRIKKKLIDVTNSDEGGRFNNNQSKNITYEIEGLTELEKQNFIWISYNQMLELLDKKLLTIELRNLFGILNIKELK